MAGDIKGLRASWTDRTNEAKRKVAVAISELSHLATPINFNSVSKHSGVSKGFLYGNQEVRAMIEEYRQAAVETEINRHAKFDKTPNSKDVIIKAKDKRIAKLEAENRKLKSDIERLRGKLYEMD